LLADGSFEDGVCKVRAAGGGVEQVLGLAGAIATTHAVK